MLKSENVSIVLGCRCCHLEMVLDKEVVDGEALLCDQYSAIIILKHDVTHPEAVEMLALEVEDSEEAESELQMISNKRPGFGDNFLPRSKGRRRGRACRGSTRSLTAPVSNLYRKLSIAVQGYLRIDDISHC